MIVHLRYRDDGRELDADDAWLLDSLRRLYPATSGPAEWTFELHQGSGTPAADGAVVRLPMKFYRPLPAGVPENFDEHAQKKLLYHALSSEYMTAIAGDTEAEVRFLLHVAGKTPHNVLDLCCGVGRHAAGLAAHGCHVTGVDASAEQISTANALHPSPRLRFLQMDVRRLALPQRAFDLAICMWTTYNYFSVERDLRAFLGAVARHQPAGALFVLDAKNLPALPPRRIYHRTRRHGTEELELLVHKRVMAGIQNSQYFYFFGGSRHAFCFDEEFVRFYDPGTLSALAGDWYELAATYGDFDASAYEPAHSRRFLAVLRRK